MLKKIKKYPSEEPMRNDVNSTNCTNKYSQVENVMKKVLFTLGLLFTTAVIADDRPVADKDLIAELTQYCTELAEEDGTDGKELKVFLSIIIYKSILMTHKLYIYLTNTYLV